MCTMIKVLQCRQRHLVALSFAIQNCISWNVQSLPVLNLKFNNCVVSPSESAKSLGVTLTKFLDFNSFISKKVQICSFHLKNLYHIKNSLPFNIRVILVTNLVLSNIDYCNSLLIGATDKDLKPLQRIINRSVRFIFDLKRRDHTSLFMFKLHFLPIRYRIIFKVCLIAFKIVHKLSPDYLLDGFEIFEPTTSINLRIGQGRDNHMLRYPSMKFENKSLLSKLTFHWNRLPYNMRVIQSISNFKSQLKTHLFKKAYPQLC